MYSLNKIITAIVASVTCLSAFSGNIGGGEDKKREANDTLAIHPEDILDDDTLLAFPAHELYEQWNTTDIHPYRFDIAKTIDSVVINLNDPTYCGYFHPIEGNVNSNFGYRKHRFHYGIDIDLNTGDPVKCAFEGKVRIAQRSKTYGNVVVVRHLNGLETLYAHLSRIDVAVGQDLDPGQLIGLGGNTGRSTGSHLHFEIRYMGEPINPNDIISFENCALAGDQLVLTKENFKYLNEIRMVRYHKVKKGETLSSIARKYGTSVTTLCKLNRLSKRSTLRVGQKIRYR